MNRLPSVAPAFFHSLSILFAKSAIYRLPH